MTLTFKLRFHTRYGQSLWLTGDHEILGGGEVERATPLRYLDQEFWQASITLPKEAATNVEIHYNYVLREADGLAIQDWGNGRAINPAAFAQEEVLIVDAWNNEGFLENAFYTEPFQQVLLKPNHTEVRGPALSDATHTFKVKAPLLEKGQTLCLLGDAAALGNWDTAQPPLLDRTAGSDFLSVRLNLSNQSFPLTYKYGVYDVERKVFVRHEAGGNRILYDASAPDKHTIVHDGFAVLPADTWKGAGVAIPVFSLRSENSFGVGEFEDLKRLADWTAQAGLKLIQILPVNDTTATHTWTDSYPYAAVSAFALHPLYLNLAAVANVKNKKLLTALEPERRRLNALDMVDYEAVMKAKLGFIRQIFPSQKAATFRSRDYRKFFADNRHWLEPYAVFCYWRDQYGTPDFNRWPPHRRYLPDENAALAAGRGSPSGVRRSTTPITPPGEATDEPPRKGEGTAREDRPSQSFVPTGDRPTKSSAPGDLSLHYFIQYHLHRQLKEAAEYAHGLGIILKGDIAIGVHRHGADVWQAPELFHTDMLAGAPPDAFAAKGQNWSLPTYNWPRMRQDGFAWWKRRFEQMSNYFDAFRIDHILGFFRIWSIPAHAVEGILGCFVPAIPVEADELAARGIAFDRKRFTRPFITDAILAEIFGNDTGTVHRDFLDVNASGIYSLKPEFAAQRQVESHFAALEKSERNAKLKIGLFDLISNVILFEVEGKFHFRFGMEQTTSFKYLPPETREKLKALYVDYFFRRQDDFWRKEAMQKLPALKRATNMLVCGEDLGFVPACVPEVMRQLGLLSLEVQRMPKGLNREFSRPADAPYLSVVTPSSHDMSTIRGWWEEDAKLTQRFYNQELGLPGDAPPHCETPINRAIVDQHLASPAMWSIFQLQDLLGMDESLRREDVAAERINVPAIPNYYWRYRMHLTLERLQKADSFNAELRRLVAQSGR
ncbi:MAG TPA: 4-alpha-glucanotransferase [Verrucomicrobiae bacterium]|nr:4-alpha-glucanotransferase [Verrucomicrobiae bacterium]